MTKFKTKTWNGQSATFVQLKMDGNYTRIETNEFGGVTVHTSRPTDITEKVTWAEWLKPHFLRVPHGTIVLGELYVPGQPCSVVKTAINERWDNLKFSAFAVETLPATAPLEEVAEFCRSHGIDFLKWRRIKEGDTVEALFENLPFGAEGYVLKDANLLNWYKLKPVKTIDLIVDDFTEGDGKYYGQIGSLVCKTIEGFEVASISGMDDDVRAEVSANPLAFRSKIAEVHYQGVGSRGRLRHPRFIQWREDKHPEDCGIDQEPELEEFWNAV